MGNRKNSGKLTKFAVIVACILALIGSFAEVAATNVLAAYEYDVDATETRFGVTLPGAGWKFTGNNAYLMSIHFRLTNTSEAGGYLRAIVCDSIDMTTPLEVTNQVNLANQFMSPAGTYVWVDFNFAGTTLLEEFTTYYIGWVANGSITNDFSAQYDVQGGNDALFSNDGINWTVTSNGWVYELYTSDTGTPLPPGSSGWETQDTSELIDNAVSFLVPVIVMLLPAVLFVIFFKRTDKWLILIGLAIGVGLGYYFFGIPVWLVFLVAIGLIGLAYSEVRRGG